MARVSETDAVASVGRYTAHNPTVSPRTSRAPRNYLFGETASQTATDRKQMKPHTFLVLWLLVLPMIPVVVVDQAEAQIPTAAARVYIRQNHNQPMKGMWMPIPMLVAAGLRTAQAPPHRSDKISNLTELDGCLTIEGSMPKLTLFHSHTTYRLQPGTGLQTENPLVFAPMNANSLVHVTGHAAPFKDPYDPDHSPVFVVDRLMKLAATCNVTIPLARLRQELAAPRTASPAPAVSTGGTPVVNMTGELLVFEPPTITIKAGETVKWKNSSGEVHTVTADPHKATNAADVELPRGAKPFDSGYLNPGQAYTHLFRTPGTYRYVCTLHEVQHMVGQVIVKP